MEILNLNLRELNFARANIRKMQAEEQIREELRAKLRNEMRRFYRDDNTTAANTTKAGNATPTGDNTPRVKKYVRANTTAINSTKSNNTKDSPKDGPKDDQKGDGNGKHDSLDDDPVFQAKLEEAVEKRLEEEGGNCDDDYDDEDNPRRRKNNRRGLGTNVFDKKINATNAVGYVGRYNHSINRPPYKIKRCDQILLIPGKKMNNKNYCIKQNAFMTMSIYMMNFFLEKNPDKLIESFPMYEITQIPTKMSGAPGCTTWKTKHRSFNFCYRNEAILDQVIKAYYAFLNCRRGNTNGIAGELFKACDVKKLDLSPYGPFGDQAQTYKDMIKQLDPRAFDVELHDAAGVKGKINPYYIENHQIGVPGDYIPMVTEEMIRDMQNPDLYDARPQ